jgi:hypothetical protein
VGCRCFETLIDGAPVGGGGVSPPVVLPTYDLWGQPATQVVAVPALTEVDVIGYVLPANRISANGQALHARVTGDWQYPAGPGNMRWRITWALGGVVLWQGNMNTTPASASRYPFSLDVIISRVGATLASLGGLQHLQRGVIAPSSFGIGALTQSSSTLDGGPMTSGPADVVVDWSVPQTVSMLVRPDTDAGFFTVRTAQVWTPSA